jgi:uncharacterized protein (TIRG00374 family)
MLSATTSPATRDRARAACVRASRRGRFGDVRVKHPLRTAAGLLGVAAFAWFVAETGPAAVAREFRELGAWTFVLLLPYACVYLLDTLAWRYSFRRGTAAEALSFTELFRVRTAGEAVNNLVPSAYLAGEPLKVYLATKRGVSAVDGAQSVVVAKTTMTIAQLAFVVIGAAAALHTLDADSPAYRGMLVMSAVAAAVVTALVWLQARGMFTSLLVLARRLRAHVGILERNEAQLRKLDATIVGFYRDERGRFVSTTLLHLCGWLAGVAEVWLGARLLGADIHVTQAIAIEAFTVVAKGVGAFAPGSIGVQESSIVLLFRIFALPAPIAVSYALLRRGRELLWVALGALLVVREESSLSALAAWLRPGSEAAEPRAGH